MSADSRTLSTLYIAMLLGVYTGLVRVAVEEHWPDLVPLIAGVLLAYASRRIARRDLPKDMR